MAAGVSSMLGEGIMRDQQGNNILIYAIRVMHATINDSKLVA
jgi:hypothetical protein